MTKQEVIELKARVFVDLNSKNKVEWVPESKNNEELNKMPFEIAFNVSCAKEQKTEAPKKIRDILLSDKGKYVWMDICTAKEIEKWRALDVVFIFEEGTLSGVLS